VPGPSFIPGTADEDTAPCISPKKPVSGQIIAPLRQPRTAMGGSALHCVRISRTGNLSMIVPASPHYRIRRIPRPGQGAFVRIFRIKENHTVPPTCKRSAEAGSPDLRRVHDGGRRPESREDRRVFEEQHSSPGSPGIFEGNPAAGTGRL